VGRQQQIPPLRCGMTNKRTGNGNSDSTNKGNSNNKGNRRSFDSAALRSG